VFSTTKKSIFICGASVLLYAAQMEDKVVVTYGDTTLYESDVALLRPGEWLNDSIVSFWLEYLLPSSAHRNALPVIDSIVLCRYLAKERFKDHQDELLFIDPSAMFMINFSDGRACSPCV